MKSFIMANWRRIIFVITGIAIAVNLYFVMFTPATVIDDFYKYGPNVKSDIISSTTDFTMDADDSIDSAADRMASDTGINFGNARVIIIFALLMCGALILSNIIDGKQAAPAKKK